MPLAAIPIDRRFSDDQPSRGFSRETGAEAIPSFLTRMPLADIPITRRFSDDQPSRGFSREKRGAEAIPSFLTPGCNWLTSRSPVTSATISRAAASAARSLRSRSLISDLDARG